MRRRTPSRIVIVINHDWQSARDAGSSSAWRRVKFGVATGEVLEPDLMNPAIRTAYAARIAKFRATVSLVNATGVAMMLKHGVDRLSKGAVNPVGCDDSNEDGMATVERRWRHQGH